YQCFSNRSPYPVIHNNTEYPTAEHLFQAFKLRDNPPDIAEGFRAVSKLPTEAFKCSVRRISYKHPDWDRVITAKMELAMWHKFSQNTKLKRKLLATGDAELVNDTQHDFWGVGRDQRGRNEGGKALERVRDSLRNL
ncbi:hypothetical protein B0H12DRAFT_1031728, partial [Mycena haematopus]